MEDYSSNENMRQNKDQSEQIEVSQYLDLLYRE